MRPIPRNLLAFLMQLPPTMFAKEGVKKTKALIHVLNPDFRYAIEVGNTSWSDKSIYKPFVRRQQQLSGIESIRPNQDGM